jgi:hypothetical protein
VPVPLILLLFTEKQHKGTKNLKKDIAFYCF